MVIIVGIIALVLGLWVGMSLMWRYAVRGIILATIDAAEASGANATRFAANLAADERLLAPLRKVWAENLT